MSQDLIKLTMTATELENYQKQLLFHFAQHVKMILFHFFGCADFSKGRRINLFIYKLFIKNLFKKLLINYMHTSREKKPNRNTSKEKEVGTFSGYTTNLII